LINLNRSRFFRAAQFGFAALLTFGLLASCSNSSDVREPAVSDDFQLTKVDKPENVKDSQVLAFLCEMIMQKPDSATPYCADFGEAVFDITWTRWSAMGAEGFGTHSKNDCNPDCASGSITKTKVAVKLENLYTDGKRYFLRDFSFVSINEDASEVPISGGWDTADFYINVPDMRSDG